MEITPQEAFAAADAVFSGIVLELIVAEPFPGGGLENRATFQVIDCWKGSPGSVALVWTPLTEAGCGFMFVVGNDYLVYADDFLADDLWTHLCTRTQNWPPLPEDLAFLGEPGSCAPISLHDTTWGRVKTLYR